MNLSSLPPCPTAFKSINPYLQRAKEMEKVDPVISYWCAFHAAQTCMSIGHNEPESREFLMSLLDLLENAKGKLSDNDAITNNLAATAYVENFALKIFHGADREDQQGLSSRTTAQRFLAAACFLEVLQSLTNQPESDIMQKIKYSKWKAGSIAKAIREGTGSQQPQPGENWELVNQQVASPGSVNSGEAIGKFLTRIDMSNKPVPGVQQAMSGTGSERMEGDDWPKELGGTNSINKLPSPISGSSSANPFSNINHNNIDDHNNHLQSNKPSPFPSTVFPPNQQQSHPSKPMPSDLTGVNLDHSQFTTTTTTTTTGMDTSNGVQQTFYSTPSLIKTHTNQNGHASNTNATTTTTNDTLSSIDPIKISMAQKHAKWAISALNFDDISTAKNQLQVALDTLNSI